MSYDLGIAVIVPVTEQNVIFQTTLFTAGMLSRRGSGRAAEQCDEFAPPHFDQSGHSVVGSIILRTSVILLAGKPLIFACLRMISSSLAR
jgi:hypothetical protein